MRILIAEDDPVSCRVLEAFLIKWGYEVIVARNGAEAWDELQKQDSPKLAILDWMMPGMDGVQVCRKIREETERPYVYILMLTAKDRKQHILEGIEAGADEYLTKPFQAHELRAQLYAGRRILDLQETLIRTREELRVQATHDPLTGLCNHGEILSRMRIELERAQRQATPVGVVMADLDHFKRINDTYGHPAGDAVLREVARRLRTVVRPYDSVGRYGGEEFMVVVPGCDAAGALVQAERLRISVREEPIPLAEGGIRATLSLGVAAVDNPQASDWEPLLRTADAALYRAKAAGRDRAEPPVEARVKSPAAVTIGSPPQIAEGPILSPPE